ncbi:RagB/SusD family nutrient uptake outer membrane protein [Pontibacter sp. G13]|uniref:RagB/SusD family nutrient uptake outer membrane protein n=1 Tax=Pontibacter sp. G13 TaxID=3074898 RepID=UPI00288B4B5A|nr:RagB/SusD family nutrient uptake outer membrane protein [Pontibacter sp. G13]WNJ16169.1 RagB/SusD family nutrient uptake outer membrane protein [Pontibacter sp. G13]
MFKHTFTKLRRGIVLGVAALSFTACSDLLEKVPVTELVEENGIQTEQDVIALTNAGYDAMQWQVIQGANTHMYPVMWQDFRADNCISQWATFWAFGLPLDDLSGIQPNNPNIAAMWRKWFTAIARANSAIYQIERFEGFETAGLEERLIAEAQFVRGFAYFELVKHFGGVPLINEFISSTDDEIFRSRASVQEIYAQIESDLLAAAQVLPASYGDVDKGRATSGAAYTLLAKAHLYQGEYDEVRQYTETVINSGEYALEGDFASNWDLSNEYGIESIFEIGYADGFSNFYFEAPGGNTNQGSSSYQMFGYIFANNGTFGNGVPRQGLIEMYDSTDTRLDATFILPSTDYYELGVQTCFCDNQDNYIGTDIYNFFWTNPEALATKASMRKYDIPPTVGASLLNTGSSPLNEKVLRYADVLLMHAEAAAMGAGGDGQSSLDEVRARAGLESVALTMDHVKMERRKELATEGWDRFTDLVRWGDAADALAFKNFQVGRDELLPIPQEEIDLVGADILTQNPGYN